MFRKKATNLKPQSSHSSTGFHPNLFVQMSHLATSSALEKNRSSGFQPDSFDRVGDAVPPLFVVGAGFFVPGLMSVKRCTIGKERIVEPPSVAAAMDGTIEERVVW